MIKEVKIELTNKCSRNCIHCSSNATNNLGEKLELDFEDVNKTLIYAKKMGVESIVFTGGEPLMYAGLVDLVKIAKFFRFKTTIYTYASRNDETLTMYRYLILNGLDKIVYSISDSLSLYDESVYSLEEFFDAVFEGTNAKLGFHYTVNKNSLDNLGYIVTNNLNIFKDKTYFDKISLLRFVPHGRGTNAMDLTKEDMFKIKDFYLSLDEKNLVRLGSPWNILGISNTPCTIADESVILGFDGILYPCDSIKYFKDAGISGTVKENTLMELYNSEYFKMLRDINMNYQCDNCANYQICQSGCIGQKIIQYYDKEKSLSRCASYRDPKCMR